MGKINQRNIGANYEVINTRNFVVLSGTKITCFLKRGKMRLKKGIRVGRSISDALLLLSWVLSLLGLRFCVNH